MIDSDIRHPWPEAVTACLPLLRQGMIVERPPLTYVASPRHWLWALSNTGEDLPADEDIIADEDGPPYGIITTQTCDIDEQRPEPRQPWVQIAPVYDIAPPARDSHQSLPQYLVQLTPTDLPAARWVCDLRIEVSVEKGWLVGKPAYRGFQSEAEFGAFSERLAWRRSRPYLGNIVVDLVSDPLRDALDGLRTSGALTGVEEIRLLVDGDPDEPDRVGLLVIASQPPEPGSVDAWDDWWHIAHEAAAAHEPSLDIVPIRHETMQTMTAWEYAHSALLSTYRLR